MIRHEHIEAFKARIGTEGFEQARSRHSRRVSPTGTTGEKHSGSQGLARLRCRSYQELSLGRKATLSFKSI